MAEKRICILVVAYNAISTLASVLDRIPAAVWEKVEEVLVLDDASGDDTYILAEGYKKVRGREKLTIVRHALNLGYGGNQKAGFRYVLERGYDVVVLLHGDGQYAPEILPQLLEPLLSDEADVVLGSRMLVPGGALKGGMPLYKFVGNKILSGFQNWISAHTLSEWHSGYRLYSTKALRDLPLDANTNDFHFDTEILLQLQDRGFRIAELPIPTYYGNEICRVNGLKYARDVFRVMIEHRLHRIGLRSAPKFFLPSEVAYEAKPNPWSSHARIARAVPPGCRVLDIGCEPAVVESFLQKRCRVVGINRRPLGEPIASRLERFIQADLEREFPVPPEEKFDRVILADVLEHVRNAPQVLSEAADRLAPHGRVLLSTGNVAHIWIRLNLLFGRFHYGRRGILDETHVKLYTLDTFLELIRGAGLDPLRIWATPVPFELAIPRYATSWGVKMATTLSAACADVWKRMFAFQFVVEAQIDPAARPDRPAVHRPGESVQRVPVVER